MLNHLLFTLNHIFLILHILLLMLHKTFFIMLRVILVERVQLLGKFLVWKSQLVIYYFILMIVGGQVIDRKIIFHIHQIDVMWLFLSTELQTVYLWHLDRFWLSLSSQIKLILHLPLLSCWRINRVLKLVCFCVRMIVTVLAYTLIVTVYFIFIIEKTLLTPIKPKILKMFLLSFSYLLVFYLCQHSHTLLVQYWNECTFFQLILCLNHLLFQFLL